MSEKEMDWKGIPVYKDSGYIVRENNELDMFRASNAANKACAEAIEKAITENWDGSRLKEGCVQPIIEQFGEQRLMFVLANTLQLHATDKRFSRDNLAWAQMVQIEPVSTEEPAERRYSWDIHSHPVKLDDFAVQTRKAIEEEAIRETPVFQYALENEETIPYWDSHKCNVACRHDIEQAIQDHFDGYTLHGGAPNAVLQKYGEERTLYVLANTIQLMRDDGRVSRKNIQWADTFSIANGTSADDSQRREFMVREHPGLFDLFTKVTRDTVRNSRTKQLEQKMGKGEDHRPSILKQLGNPHADSAIDRSPTRKKEQAR